MARLSKRQLERWFLVQRAFRRTTVAVVTLLSIAVWLTYLVVVTRTSGFGLAPLLLVGSLGILLWHRKQLSWLPLHSRPSALVQRYLLFPGYLMTMGSSLAVASVVIGSTQLAATASVLYLGWVLAKRTADSSWNAVAAAWAICFVACVSPAYFIAVHSGLNQSSINVASSLMNDRDYDHVIETTAIPKLWFIDSGNHLSLPPLARWITSYSLLVVTAIWIALRQFPLLWSLSMLLTAIMVGGAMNGLHCLIAWFADANAWTWWFDSLIVQRVTLATATLLVLVSAGAAFACLLAPIEDARIRRETRLNHVLRMTLGNLLRMLEPTGADGNRVGGRVIRKTARLDRGIGLYLLFHRWHLAFAAIPFLILFCGGGYSFIRWQDRDRQAAIAAHYNQRLQSEIASSNSDFAQRLLRGLDPRDPLRQAGSIQVANCLLVKNNREPAFQLIESLVALPGIHAQAHVWLARQAIQEASKANNATASIDQHLAQALAGDPANFDAITTKFLWQAASGKRQAALDTLRSQSFDEPIKELYAANLLERIGNHSDAVFRAWNAIRLIEDSARSRSALKTTWPQAALIMAASLTITGDLERASKQLLKATEEAADQARIDDPLQLQFADVYLKLYEAQARSEDGPQLDDKALQHAIRVSAQHEHLQIHCARLLLDGAKLGDDALAACRTLLVDALQAPEPSTTLLNVMGTGLVAQARFAEAEPLLRQAYERGLRTSALMNNLAVAMLKLPARDSEKALQLLDQAIGLDPDSDAARLTRASLRIDNEQWQEAIVDLERYYQLTGRPKEIAQRLAALYEKVGDQDTATRYRRMAK